MGASTEIPMSGMERGDAKGTMAGILTQEALQEKVVETESTTKRIKSSPRSQARHLERLFSPAVHPSLALLVGYPHPIGVDILSQPLIIQESDGSCTTEVLGVPSCGIV